MTIQTDRGPVEIYKRSLALVVGASRYTAGWTPLEAVPAEMAKIAAELTEQGFAVQMVADPTAATLQRTIEDFLLQSVDHSTRLVVYFAGHGWTDGRYTGYIVPTDAPPEDAPRFENHLVSIEALLQTSRRSRAKHVLFVFDSCFSGAVFLTRHNYRPSELFVADAEQKVRQVITAGSATDQVPALSDFAAAFVRGLRGEADVISDGVITGNELGYWLKAEISRLGKQTPQYGAAPEVEFRAGDVMFAPSAQAGRARVAFAPPVPANAAQRVRLAAVRAFGRPSDDRGQLFEGINILYYEKTGDEGTIRRVLDAARIPYARTRAELPERFRMNAIACGPDIPPDALRTLARTLTEGGVPIRAIIPYRRPELKPRRIELVSLSRDAAGQEELEAPPLTLEQIAALPGCGKSIIGRMPR